MTCPALLPDRDPDGNLVDYSDVFTWNPDALWQLPEDDR